MKNIGKMHSFWKILTFLSFSNYCGHITSMGRIVNYQQKSSPLLLSVDGSKLDSFTLPSNPSSHEIAMWMYLCSPHYTRYGSWLKACEHIGDIYDWEGCVTQRMTVCEASYFTKAAASHSCLPMVPRSHYSEESCINISALCHQSLN